MKRGAPLARKTPMKQSPMKPGSKPLRAKSTTKRALGTAKAPGARSSLKSKGPKMTPIRRAARGQDCTLQIPGVCNHDPATTVLCHSNFLADGKGMGLKAPDTAAAFGCCACHDVLDGRRPRPPGITAMMIEGAFYAAVQKTHSILGRMGIATTAAEK